MGSILESKALPRLEFTVSGTASLKRITIVRNETDYKVFEPSGRELRASFRGSHAGRRREPLLRPGGAVGRQHGLGVARVGDDEAVIGVLLLGLLAAADEGSGDASVDQQVRLTFRADAVALEVVVQMGRQAAFAEALQIDADRDGRLSTEEQSRYFAALEETIRANLELQVNGRPVSLRRVGELRLEMPFRKIYRFEATTPIAGRLEFHNENFPSSSGSASIVLEPGNGLDVLFEGNAQRDVVCELRPGQGRVEARTGEAVAGPSIAAVWTGLLLRLLSFIGLAGAGLLAWRRRRGAALLTLAAAGACGALSIATLPSASQAERLFLALHEDSVRAADVSLRRVKPLETRVLPSLLPEFRVRHRWATYGSLSHSGHAHAEIREHEGQFVVRWIDGAWRIVDLDGGAATSASASPGPS
jgi:hypothetical protein